MLTYKNLSYQYFFRDGAFLPLSRIADVVSGVFMRSSDFFLLDNYERQDDSSTGYSRCLKERVQLEPDIIMPMLKTSMDFAFTNEGNEERNKGLVFIEQKNFSRFTNGIDSTFLSEHPSLSSYIEECAPLFYKTNRVHPNSFNILSAKQAEVFLKGKHILYVNDDICRSFFDSEGLYAFPKEMYGIGLKSGSIPNNVFTAIFNSKLFRYLRLKESQSYGELRNAKYDSVNDYPIPDKSSDSILLSAIDAIVDCIIYTRSKAYRNSGIYSGRMEYYLLQIMDLAIFELYFSEYVHTRGLSLSDDFNDSTLLDLGMPISEKVSFIYKWFLSPNNKVRQKLMLLDTRSPELLYPIYTQISR